MTELSFKLLDLIVERGWSADEFVDQTGLDSSELDELAFPEGPPHFIVESRIAKALGLSVYEIRGLPLTILGPRVRAKKADPDQRDIDALYDQAMQPALIKWMMDHPKRAARLTQEDVDELLSLQHTGGPLTSTQVQHYLGLIERRRSIVDKLNVITYTNHFNMIETMVNLAYQDTRLKPKKARSKCS